MKVILDVLVKLAFLAIVAYQLALHRPQTWDRIWSLTLQYHKEIGMVGIGLGALLLACRDLAAPIANAIKPTAEMGGSAVKTVFDLVTRFVLTLVAMATLFVFCFIKFGPQDKGDQLWASITSLFDLAWSHALQR